MLWATRTASLSSRSTASRATSAPYVSIEQSAGSPGVSPCPRRSHASTACVPANSAICAAQSVWSHAKPCTNTISGTPLPADFTNMLDAS
jgi:hypothetical protein